MNDNSCGSIHIISLFRSGLLGLGTPLVLLSIGIVLCSMTVEVCAVDNMVQVVAADYGPATEDPLVVRFCNDSDDAYTIVLECTTKSHTLNWTSDGQYFNERIFNFNSNFCDPKNDSGFTFSLISRDNLYGNKGNSLYVSQLRVSTSTLANVIPSSGEMKVTCQALDTKYEIVLIRISGTFKLYPHINSLW